MTNDELRRRVKRLATKVEHVARMTRAELCHMAVGREHLMKNYLRNDGHNSCYLDSILVALLAAQRNCNSWVHKHVWRSKPNEIWAQNPELAELAMRIRDELKLTMFPLDVINARHPSTGRNPVTRNASALRRMLHDFDSLYSTQIFRISPRTEWLEAQNDPLDVLSALYRIFQVPDDAYAKLGPNKQRVSITAHMIDVFTLLEHSAHANTPLRVKDVVPLNAPAQTEVLRAPLLYVSVQRNYMDKKKVKTPVLVAKTVTPRSSDRAMKLSAIIVHIGRSPTHGHYVAYICDHRTGTWFLYDDTEPELERIGSFRTVAGDPTIQANVVGLLYS
jgi:hypothetical protein